MLIKSIRLNSNENVRKNRKASAFSLIGKATIIIFLFTLFYSCVTEPGDQKDNPLQTICYDTLALSDNPLMPGRVGSYWKYNMYVYSKTKKYENDSMWVYKDFNSFKIDFSDTSLIHYESSQREIAKILTVHYGDYCYDVMAYINSSLSYENSEKLYWLYWIGPEGIYEMGGYNDSDTLISKGLQIPYPLKKGDNWKGQITYYNGDNFEAKEVILRKCVADNEKLVTPFFTADSCYVILTRVRQAEDVVSYYDYYRYYVPNEGLVFQVIKGTSYDNRAWSIESISVEYEHLIK